MTTIHNIAVFLETWAPKDTAQSYDNVGLQVGDAAREVTTALVALDLTPAVIAEAQAIGAELVVTHHPVIFKPIRNVTAGALVPELIFRMAEAGIALYTAHTNLDAAHGGVSYALAEQLGLTDIRFLQPDPGTNDPPTGMGAIGTLNEAMSLADFLAHTSAVLGADSLRYAGPRPNTPLRTVAVCGGSGSSLTRTAIRAGADAYVTADVTYHLFFDVMRPDGSYAMALIDAGHYETEAITEALLVGRLSEAFPAVRWHRTRHRTSPMQTFTSSPSATQEPR
ncbi:MAG: Nif3-like dinuclear metal center hexameric protein [Bacteroidota bacterium]